LFARRSLLLFGAIILAYTSNALFMRAYNHHLIEKLGWLDTDVSVLTGTYGMIVATVIALTGGYLADRIGARRLLVIMLGVVAVYLIGFNLLSEAWVQRDIARTGLVALNFLDPAVSAAAMPGADGHLPEGGRRIAVYDVYGVCEPGRYCRYVLRRECPALPVCPRHRAGCGYAGRCGQRALRC
jgi:MFS family permease